MIFQKYIWEHYSTRFRDCRQGPAQQDNFFKLMIQLFTKNLLNETKIVDFRKTDSSREKSGNRLTLLTSAMEWQSLRCLNWNGLFFLSPITLKKNIIS